MAPNMFRACTVSIILLASAIPTLAHGAAPVALPIGPKQIFPILSAQGETRAADAANDLIYHGGPILKVPAIYITFWGWGGSDPSGEAAYLQSFFNGVGGSAWLDIDTQYTSTSQGAITNPTGQLKGIWYDDDLPTAGGVLPIPDLYISNEAVRSANHFGYSADANYLVATPHLHNDAEFGAVYCAWHSTVTNLGRVIAYTNLPYIPDAPFGTCGENSVNSGNAGLLDGVSIVAGHEYSEAITDPHIDAWYDSGGQENADKCAWRSSGPGAMKNIVLSTGTFAVQGHWSNAVSDCAV